MLNRETILRRRLRLWTWIFIVGLVISGATAIPLGPEVEGLTRLLGASDKTSGNTTGMAHWILRVREALRETDGKYPFLAYGTDWLAFGHFVIAVAFVGALRDPVRNVWLYTFGMIACGLIVPYAFVMGGMRGIPVEWRLIDCCFGVFGIIPVWLCRKWVREIESIKGAG